MTARRRVRSLGPYARADGARPSLRRHLRGLRPRCAPAGPAGDVRGGHRPERLVDGRGMAHHDRMACTGPRVTGARRRLRLRRAGGRPREQDRRGGRRRRRQRPRDRDRGRARAPGEPRHARPVRGGRRVRPAAVRERILRRRHLHRRHQPPARWEAVLAEWHRLLRPGGSLLFTDPVVVTGLLSSEEIALRASIGFFVYSLRCEDARLVREAGFELVRCDDTTDRVAEVSRRWHDARARHAAELLDDEGEETFEALQCFLSMVHTLSSERRLSRYTVLARKRR